MLFVVVVLDFRAGVACVASSGTMDLVLAEEALRSDPTQIF